MGQSDFLTQGFIRGGTGERAPGLCFSLLYHRSCLPFMTTGSGDSVLPVTLVHSPIAPCYRVAGKRQTRRERKENPAQSEPSKLFTATGTMRSSEQQRTSKRSGRQNVGDVRYVSRCQKERLRPVEDNEPEGGYRLVLVDQK